jgi:hypothetical protein
MPIYNLLHSTGGDGLYQSRELTLMPARGDTEMLRMNLPEATAVARQQQSISLFF